MSKEEEVKIEDAMKGCILLREELVDFILKISKSIGQNEIEKKHAYGTLLMIAETIKGDKELLEKMGINVKDLLKK